MLSGLLMSMGAVLLIVAGVIAWGSWSGRSSAPLDDQLPYLLGVEPADASEAVDGPAQGDAGLATGVVAGQATPAARATPEAAPAMDGEDPVAGGRGSTPHVASPQVASPQVASPQVAGAQIAPGSGSESQAAIVVVHVSGAVTQPGVVELMSGARVHHAVDAAGGAAALADLERVNLAALLVDGERIHVPEIGEADVPDVVAPSRTTGLVVEGAAGVDVEEPVAVDVNRASVGELERLPGVGPAIARAILDLRTVRGAYASVDELLLVDGIGPAKLEALRPHAFVALGG